MSAATKRKPRRQSFLVKWQSALQVRCLRVCKPNTRLCMRTAPRNGNGKRFLRSAILLWLKTHASSVVFAVVLSLAPCRIQSNRHLSLFFFLRQSVRKKASNHVKRDQVNLEGTKRTLSRFAKIAIRCGWASNATPRELKQRGERRTNMSGTLMDHICVMLPLSVAVKVTWSLTGCRRAQ